jgi:hypothetical protein
MQSAVKEVTNQLLRKLWWYHTISLGVANAEGYVLVLWTLQLFSSLF